MSVMRMARMSRACRPSLVKVASEGPSGEFGSSVMRLFPRCPSERNFVSGGTDVVLHGGIFLGVQRQADNVHQAGDAAKDDADNRDPGLMEVAVKPCADEPADKGRAGQNERDLHQFFGLNPGAHEASGLAVSLGVRNGAMVGHPSWLYTRDAVRRDADRADAERLLASWCRHRKSRVFQPVRSPCRR